MNNRKKNTPVRDEFTDALTEELNTRKIFERAKPVNEISDDIFLSEFIEETSASAKVEKKKTQTKKSRPKKKSAAKKSPEVKPQEKIISPPKLEKLPPMSVSELKAESNLEKRIFAEAENDFYDEKPMFENESNMRSKISSGKYKSSAYRSSYFKEPEQEFEEVKNKKDEEYLPDFDPNLRKKLTRAELAGVAISALLLCDSFLNLDKPLFFMSLSLFSFLLRPLIGSFCGKYNRAVQNAIHSFSIVLFIGALIFLFQG